MLCRVFNEASRHLGLQLELHYPRRSRFAPMFERLCSKKTVILDHEVDKGIRRKGRFRGPLRSWKIRKGIEVVAREGIEPPTLRI